MVVNGGDGSDSNSSEDVVFRRDVESGGRNCPSKNIFHMQVTLHDKNILIVDQKMGI